MRNFNLLISTSRFNETNAKAELWFILLMCGDKYPIISNLEFPGLFSALSSVDNRLIMRKVREILQTNPNFFQFILKIVPIDFICETSIGAIKNFIEKKFNDFLDPENTFKIDLKRRKNKLIEREILIESVAKLIDNPVDLDNPDRIVRIELLGNISGISFLSPDEIISTGVRNP